MVGFSASWKVIGLVSGLALISSDWLVEMKRTFAFLVCSLIAICTCAARAAVVVKNTRRFMGDSFVRASGADHRGGFGGCQTAGRARRVPSVARREVLSL